MKHTTLFSKSLLRTLLVLPLAIGLQAAPAQAQEKAAAATTLDVCHNEATGNWRYSGVVSVLSGAAPGTSMVKVGYWIQNKVSDSGYTDAFQAPQIHAAPEVAGMAKVSGYSIEAAPLLLGTLRNMVRVSISDALHLKAPAISLQPSYELAASVCGCGHPKGCVRTQGYWSNKPGVVWPAPYSRTEGFFFSSMMTWQQIMDTSSRGGNAYIILAHQYIAALLNQAAGASVPAAVQTVIDNATTFFQSGTTPASCSNNECATQKTWAGILDTYNNGLYPGAPKACPE